jgi:hypothetical protein
MGLLNGSHSAVQQWLLAKQPPSCLLGSRNNCNFAETNSSLRNWLMPGQGLSFQLKDEGTDTVLRDKDYQVWSNRVMMPDRGKSKKLQEKKSTYEFCAL